MLDDVKGLLFLFLLRLSSAFDYILSKVIAKFDLSNKVSDLQNYFSISKYVRTSLNKRARPHIVNY